MSTSNEFDKMRRERARRVRLRKKRIRAAVLLIAFIGIIVIICVAVSTCGKNDTQAPPEDNISEENAVVSEDIVPTIAPAEITPGNIPPASQENNLIEIISSAGQEKRCYLTFDDGPTKNITPQILDTLRRYNVKATFFEVGSLIQANPDIARRVYEEGHLIANHSNSHNYEKLYATSETFINEINQCYENIKSVTDGEEPFKLVRFPGGSYESENDSYSSVKQEGKELLKENGFYYCDWNSSIGDAEGKSKDAAGMLSYLKQTLNTNKNAIILMHDAASKQTTVDALASIIEYLASEGYTFHRLDDIDYHGSVDTVSDNTVSASAYSSTAAADTSSASENISSAEPSESSEELNTPTPVPEATPVQSGGVIVIQ